MWTIISALTDSVLMSSTFFGSVSLCNNVSNSGGRKNQM
jgi:hypothetical protein